MAAVVSPKWFVDETSLGLAKILAIARDDVVHPGHFSLPEVPTGTYDEVWMPIVARKDLVVIGRDKKIRTKPAELAAFKRLRLRAFWIAGKRDLSNWENLKLIVKWWDRLEEIVDDLGPGPWFYAISDGAIREIAVS
jgi:PIN domain-containing protein